MRRRWRHHRPAAVSQHARQVPGGGEAIGQVVLVEHLDEPLGQRLQIAPGQAAVGHEALGADQLHADLLGQRVVADAEQAAHVHDGVLLGAHGEHIGQLEHRAGRRSERLEPRRLVAPDPVRVLGEATGVQHQHDPARATALGHGPQVGQRHGLTAHGVVGHRHHHERDLALVRLERRIERRQRHVAAERVVRRERVVERQVDTGGPGRLDVGAGGVEQAVGQHHAAGQRHDRAQDPLGRATLVRGVHVRHSGEIVHHLLQPEEAARAGIRLVAAHHGRPLLCAHRAGARVRQQIDDHVLGVYAEQVVVRALEDRAALVGGSDADRLHDLDTEGLDDRTRARHARARSAFYALRAAEAAR